MWGALNIPRQSELPLYLLFETYRMLLASIGGGTKLSVSVRHQPEIPFNYFLLAL